MAEQQIPSFTLPHVAGGADVSSSEYSGRTFVLAFAGRSSGDQAEKISDTLRAKYTVEALPVVQIANLKGVPGFVKGLAKKDITKAYQKESQKEAARLQAQGKLVPDDLSHSVVMLLDWDGAVAGGLGLSDIDKTAVALLVDGDGKVCGTGTGAQGGEQILSMLG